MAADQCANYEGMACLAPQKRKGFQAFRSLVPAATALRERYGINPVPIPEKMWRWLYVQDYQPR